MKQILLFTFLVLSSLCRAEESNDETLVRVGDSVDAVRNHLGEPTIEFPLNGQLIQDYDSCVITSENGVVVSIQQRKQTTPKSEDAKAAAYAKALLAKAKEGDADAQYRLAYCYQTGKGVDRNPEEFVRWYTLSAMQGNAAAQHNLGVIYMTGDGVDRDYEQAYTWGVLAAQNGNDTLVVALIPRLTTEQELAGRLRAGRIRDGLEPSPYGSPNESSAIAKKDAPKGKPPVD